MNIANAKLTPNQVQQVRALHGAGFTAKSIAPAFGICQREVINIIKGRAWWFLPVESVPLPLFTMEQAPVLKHRSTKRLTAAHQEALAVYRKQLAEQIEIAAEREAYAMKLAADWRIKRPTGKRQVRRTVEVAS